jgi:AcrR family transcriptional regulator
MGDAGAATKRRILAAALDIAGREGLDALRTRRVAEAAGVNLGLLHYYFGSKEELVRETLDEYLDELGPALERRPAEADGRDAEDFLVDLFASALAVLARRPAILFGMVGRLISQVRKSIARGGEPGFPLEGASMTPFGAFSMIRSLVMPRIRTALAARLGADQELVSRRALQLFGSVFHPIVITPFAAQVFGVDLSDDAKRLAYIKAVVAEALTPPALSPRGTTGS